MTLQPRAHTASDEFSVDGKFITHGSNGFGFDFDNLDNKPSKAGQLDDKSNCYTLGKLRDIGTVKRTTDPLFSLYCGFADNGAPTKSGVAGSDGYQWPTTYADQKVGFDDDSTSVYKTTVTKFFKVSTGLSTSDVTLREPLWYMAKYGAFDTGEKQTTPWADRQATTAVPDALGTAIGGNYSNSNWDSLKNNGSLCAGNRCGDGEPDGYFLARRPELLASRLNDLLDREVTKSNTAVSVSSAQLIDGSFKYVATFNDAGDMRFGDVEAYQLGANGTFPALPSWTFGSFLTTAANRSVITNTLVDGVQTGVPFAAALVTEGQAGYSAPYVTALAGGTDASAQANAARIVAYMRGDRSAEGAYWRIRPAVNVMGQVVNSTPWIQDPAATARFTDGSFASGTPSYTDFVTGRVGRTKVLWVGSNDGMLHGFAATTGTALLSYVPSPVVSRLVSAFTLSNGTATPLVDGAVFTADVLNTAGATAAWRTYLFGNLGRGGKAVFALDVSNTGTSSTTGGLSQDNASSLFKWVFTVDDDADMGHVIATPTIHRASGQAQQVVRLNNGRFGLLVPNGYLSANGRPVLYILFTDGPGSTGWNSAGASRNFVKLAPQATDANNGMVGVTWVDLNNDGTADVLYATDLRGQVWKFDVRSSDPGEWGSAFKSSAGVAVPFFTAKGCAGTGTARSCNAAASITTSPVATLPKFGGVMLSMGTGRALSSGDFPNSALTNRFISVWDKGRYPEDQVFPAPSTLPTGYTQPSLPSMYPVAATPTFAQILLRRSEGANGTGNVYRVTINSQGAEVPVASTSLDDVFDPAVHDGWYFDFPSSGEQLISSPKASAQFVSFTSVRPQSSSDLAKSCLTDPLGTFYAVNPSTGLPIAGLFSTETIGGVTTVVYGQAVTDQQITITSDRSTGNQSGSSGSTATTCGAGRVKARFLGQLTDGNGCVAAANVRLQWREINGMKTK